MAAASERVLIVTDAGLPALVTCLMAPDPDRVVAWAPPIGADLGEGAITPIHHQAAEEQAEMLSLGEFVTPSEAWPAAKPGSRPAEAWSGFDEDRRVTSLLLEACAEALRRNCSRVIWPVACGADLDALFSVAERASLISRLVELSVPTSGSSPMMSLAPIVETPLADLDDIQIAEMALDLDAPVSSCWWRREQTPPSDASRRAIQRWERAIHAADRLGRATPA